MALVTTLVGEMCFDTAANFCLADRDRLTHYQALRRRERLISRRLYRGRDLEGSSVKELEHVGVEIPLRPKSMTVEGHDYRVEFIERGTTRVGG